MTPRARCCERSPGSAAARSAAELRLPPLRGWRWWRKQPAWGWTGQRLCACVCLCVCVHVHACGALGACACIYGIRGNLCSAQRWSSLLNQAGRNAGGRYSEGETHTHTRTHTYAHTHIQKRATHCISEIQEQKANPGVDRCLLAEGRKSTHISKNFLLTTNPGAPGPKITNCLLVRSQKRYSSTVLLSVMSDLEWAS